MATVGEHQQQRDQPSDVERPEPDRGVGHEHRRRQRSRGAGSLPVPFDQSDSQRGGTAPRKGRGHRRGRAMSLHHHSDTDRDRRSQRSEHILSTRVDQADHQAGHDDGSGEHHRRSPDARPHEVMVTEPRDPRIRVST